MISSCGNGGSLVKTASARYKINDQFVLIGDLEVGGDFRGIVKYLIRFK